MAIDRWPTAKGWGGNIFGPAEIRRWSAGGPNVTETKEVPCAAGQSLYQTLVGAYPEAMAGRKNTDTDNIWWRNCLGFAYYWFDQAGPGWSACK